MHGIYSDEQRDQIIAEHVNIVNVHEARLAALSKSLDRLNAESQLAVTQQKRAAAEDLMQKYSKFVNDGDIVSYRIITYFSSHIPLLPPQSPCSRSTTPSNIALTPTNAPSLSDQLISTGALHPLRRYAAQFNVGRPWDGFSGAAFEEWKSRFGSGNADEKPPGGASPCNNISPSHNLCC